MPPAAPSTAAPLPPATASTGLWALVAFVVALLAQGVTLAGHYALDDVPVVQRNPLLERGLGTLPAALRAPAWPGDLEQQPYRPLTGATFHLERLVTGGRAVPALSHGVNLLLHALVAALTAGLLLRLAPGRPLVALVGGLCVAVHPLATGAVALLTGRAALLGTVLGLLAVRFCLSYRPGREALLPAAALCLFLALLACEALVGLVPLVLVLDRWVGRDGAPWSLRTRAPVVLACLAAVGLWALLWGPHGPGASSVGAPEPGALGRVALGLEALARGALHMLVPVGFVADRTHEAVAGTGWPLEGARLVAVFVAAVALLAALFVPLRRGAPAALRAVVVAAGLLLLGAAQTLPLGAVLEDRWAYVALPAWAVLAGLAAEALARFGRSAPWRRTVVRLLPGLALAACTWLSVRVAQGLADDDTAHEHLLAVPRGHGPALLRRADRLLRGAEDARARSARLPVRHAEPELDPGRGPLLEEARQARAEALTLLASAVRHPATRADPEAWLLLATAQLDSAQHALALDSLGQARRLDPYLSGAQRAALADDPRALRRAARIYAALMRVHATLGRPQAAADAAQEVVRLEREVARLERSRPALETLFRAALLLVADGRYAEGLPVLEQVSVAGDDAALRAQALAQLEHGQRAAGERVAQLLRRGREQQESVDTMRLAVEAYEEALRIDPASFEARYWAAQLRGMHFGSYERAIESVDEGLRRLGLTTPSAERERQRQQLGELRTRLVERRDREEGE